MIQWTASVFGEQHQFDPTPSIEIPEMIGEPSDALGWTTTEYRLETPLSLANVVRRRDGVLELVLPS